MSSTITVQPSHIFQMQPRHLQPQQITVPLLYFQYPSTPEKWTTKHYQDHRVYMQLQSGGHQHGPAVVKSGDLLERWLLEI